MVSATHQHELAVDKHMPPPHPTLLGLHRTPALGSLCDTAVSRWLAALYMVMYMFQCYPLHSSHPLLPLHVQNSALYVCLLCCPAGRTISTTFLGSIYMH